MTVTRSTLSAVVLGNFAALQGMVPVSTVLPTVAQEFGLSIQDASLAMTSFLLMLAALVLIAGRLGDLLGYRRVFTTGLLLYALGALLSGLAGEFWQVVVARALSGAGAAMITGTSVAVIMAVVGVAQRGRAISLITVSASAGSVLGTSLAPLFLAHLSWRWVLFLAVPLALLALVPAQRIPATPAAPQRRVDLLGGVLLFGALVALALSFNHFHSGEDRFEDGWAWHLPLQSLAVLLFVAFLWVERRVAHPLLDARVLRHREIAVSVGCHGVVHMTMLASMFLVPFFIERGMALTAAHAAVVMVGANAVSSLSAPLGGWLWDRKQPPLLRPICMGLLMAGLLVTGLGLPHLVFGTFLAIQFVLGVGMGTANTLNYTIAMEHAPADQRGFVTGLLETTRQMGHTLAVVVAAALLSSGAGAGTALLPSFQLAWLVFGLIATAGTVLVALPQRRPRPATARAA